MMTVVIQGWSAWAPGLVDEGSWHAWSRSPQPLGGSGAPDVTFLPPLVRRRCSAVSRVLLYVAHACMERSKLTPLPTVFASRHGDCAGALQIMYDLADGTPVTAGAFSHSVHNTAAGIHSIATQNPAASTSTAGRSGTFGGGVIEALGLLQRSEEGRVLLVTGDVLMPEPFELETPDPSTPHALALVIGQEGDGHRVGIELDAGDVGSSAPWPDAIELLRWMLSDEPATVIGRSRNRLRWQRLPA